MNDSYTTINNIDVGRRIREIRECNALTQEELAEILGVNPNAVRAYERGAYGISKEVMCKFRKHFDVSVDYLLFGSNDDSDNLIMLVENASEADKMKILMRLMIYFVNEKKRTFTGYRDTKGIIDIFKKVLDDVK